MTWLGSFGLFIAVWVADMAALDVPLALAIVAFGVLITVDPSSVPWLMPIRDDAGNSEETAQ